MENGKVQGLGWELAFEMDMELGIFSVALLVNSAAYYITNCISQIIRHLIEEVRFLATRSEKPQNDEPPRANLMD